MKLEFDSVDELRAFVKDELKGSRGRGKGKDDESDDTGTTAGNLGAPQGLAPPPAQPPAGAPSFTPGAAPGGTFTPAGAPPSTMAAVVGRITAQVDKLIAGTVPGLAAQPADSVLQWLRSQIAPHDASAANATMDQVKQVYLNKLPEAALNEMARQIAA